MDNLLFSGVISTGAGVCSVSPPPDLLIIYPTPPTPFCSASSTCHMIAPVTFLNHDFAFETTFRVLGHPFKGTRIRGCQLSTQERLMLFTRKWWMTFSTTLKTGLEVAGAAHKEGRLVWKSATKLCGTDLDLARFVQRNRIYLHNIGSLGPIPVPS